MASNKTSSNQTPPQAGAQPLCAVKEMPNRPLDTHVNEHRAGLIRVTEKKWVNGTVIRYCFLDQPATWQGADGQKEAVRAAFAQWKGLGIGLEFREVNEPREAMLRIGFEGGAGSWSYVGRDNVDYATDPRERTMNFGWDLTTPYGRDTALHEIGHALGFSHEHQNPNAGIVWDEQAVLDYFAGAPNFWNAEKTRHNILRKLKPWETDGSEWDRDSIMHYQFPQGLILQPSQYRSQPLLPANGFSARDIAEALRFYPPLQPTLPELRPWESQRIQIGSGEQIDFMITPDVSRQYTVQTFGNMDTVMVLFEQMDGEDIFYAGDDDSGTDFNARIQVRLFRGRRYLLRIRLYYAQQSGEGAMMMW
ncbi:M12 family metallopeptidase [Aestuariibacter halophilus]|uniref:M12 family metallopeptidase n=1 Tax=Fluctibacter halophilus TaxID=226011 RepID=A0ABS8G7V7_9ALTE|nr:M12 family metallopeptidase [Aestuariibacter halophilus]MCC2616610.1 M12 family metallopeptidase [Aestuariibacter halophilus]